MNNSDPMGPYVFEDTAVSPARKRHKSTARLWDPGTFQLLDRLGVGPGWRCLEVGAGIGSVSQWLSRRVGSQGYVLASDVDPRLLALDAGNVEVRSLDVVQDEMPSASFDLVYARMVVEHTGLRTVQRMTLPLRQHGLLLIEELAFLQLPDSADGLQRIRSAIIGFMSHAGMDPLIGAKMPSAFVKAGLTDVHAVGHAHVTRGGNDDNEFARTTLSALRSTLVAGGTVTDEDCDLALAKLDDPNDFTIGPLLISTWGRRTV